MNTNTNNKIDLLSIIIKSFHASLFICIGCIVNIQCISKGLPVLGSFLFSMGLLSVCIFKSNLYTGKIGYVVKYQNYLTVFLILIFNLIFSTLLGLLSTSIISFNTLYNLIESKFDFTWKEILLKSIFCGILMYMAVDSYKKTNHYIGIILSVAIFILSGFEHCIANATYFGMMGVFSWQIVFMLLLNIIGNTIGGILIPLTKKLIKKEV